MADAREIQKFLLMITFHFAMFSIANQQLLFWQLYAFITFQSILDQHDIVFLQPLQMANISVKLTQEKLDVTLFSLYYYYIDINLKHFLLNLLLCGTF